MLIKHIKSKESMRILIQSGPSCVCLDPAFKSLWPQMFTQVVSVMRSSTTDWILIVREPQETAYKPSEGKLNKEQIQANSMQLWRKWTTAAKLRYLCCFPLAGKKKKERQRELATDVNELNYSMLFLQYIMNSFYCFADISFSKTIHMRALYHVLVNFPGCFPNCNFSKIVIDCSVSVSNILHIWLLLLRNK